MAPPAAPATFLGCELRPGGRRRLPEENVRRFRNRLRGLRDRWRAGSVSRAEVEQRVTAWVAETNRDLPVGAIPGGDGGAGVPTTGQDFRR